jgi:hypothetical protein
VVIFSGSFSWWGFLFIFSFVETFLVREKKKAKGCWVEGWFGKN